MIFMTRVDDLRKELDSLKEKKEEVSLMREIEDEKRSMTDEVSKIENEERIRNLDEKAVVKVGKQVGKGLLSIGKVLGDLVMKGAQNAAVNQKAQQETEKKQPKQKKSVKFEDRKEIKDFLG